MVDPTLWITALSLEMRVRVTSTVTRLGTAVTPISMVMGSSTSPTAALWSLTLFSSTRITMASVTPVSPSFSGAVVTVGSPS
jgi:hypothetical protein